MPGGPRIGVDPATGMLMLDGQVLSRNDPRLWGRAGRQFATGDEQYGRVLSDGGQYTRVAEEGQRDESGNRALDRYELDPEIAELLGEDNVQLSQAGWAGPNGEGWGEFNDVSLLKYDERIGFYTPRSNIRRGDPTKQAQSDRTGAFVMAALAAPAALHALGINQGAGAATAVESTDVATAVTAGDADAAAVSAGLDSTPAAATTPAAPTTPGGDGTFSLGVEEGVTAPPPSGPTEPGLIESVTGDVGVGTPPGTGTATPTPSWWNQLPPEARNILIRGGFSAVSTGASAALAGRRQQEMIDQRQREIDDARDERERRTTVPRSNVAYTPRPVTGGLIEETRRRGG